MTQDYISIDLETTGLQPKTEKIIEIGAWKVENGEITDSFSSFVNPGRKLTERITELTGIKDEDLQDAPYIEEVLPGLLNFMGDMPILGHSIMFDYTFLKKAAVNQRFSFEKKGIDTLMIARKYLPELEHRSLDYLCGYFQIPHRAHRASEDARATHILYRKLAELFYEKECAQEPEEGNLFVPRQLVITVKKEFPATIQQKKLLYRLIHRHKIDVNADIERLSRSEASRLENRIRSGQFGPLSPPDDEE